MNLRSYVESLQKFLNENPNLSETEVVITQDGYYAQGEFADLYEIPEIESIKYTNVEYSSTSYETKTTKVNKSFVVLGHSSQNY